MALVIKGLIIWGTKSRKKNPVIYDGYVKYEEAKIHRSVIMQDFRDSEKKIIIKKNNKKFKKFNWPTDGHFRFFSVKFVMGYPCVRHYILFYIHGLVILHFFVSGHSN